MTKVSKFFAAIVAIVLITSVAGTALAAEQVANNNAVVISSSVSVRVYPDTDSQRIVSLKNGNGLSVVGQEGDWYIIDLSSIGLDPGYGYARKMFIALNYRMVQCTLPETVLWADPWGTGMSVGTKGNGDLLLVLYETADWYMVQCRESTAGSAFVRKSDIHGGAVSGVPDTNNGNVISPAGNGAGKYFVNCQTLGVYPTPDDNVNRIAFLHNGDIVEVLELGDYFTKIKYELKGTPCECYVHTKYLLKVAD